MAKLDLPVMTLAVNRRFKEFVIKLTGESLAEKAIKGTAARPVIEDPQPHV
ncbi:MAG: hypothetical protein ACREQK_12755 [Candidatus Binatia bacterium]